MSFPTFFAYPMGFPMDFPMDFSQHQASPCSNSPTSLCSRRGQLTADVVLAIFELRPMRSELDGTFVPCARLVRKLAGQFQVKERTVRDIWNRRSWSNVTRPLWTPSEVVAEFGAYQGDVNFMHVLPAQTRKRGRPMGSKDATKRRPKVAAARGAPASEAVPELAFAALTERQISNLVADEASDDTSDDDILETIEHYEAAESFTCDEIEGFSPSCDEEYEEAITSEEGTEASDGAMSGSCFESNPWSW
eukprot:CAMPEP_0177703196 /NCGR_PEP_ID=MMETSP0484_2-20121128/7543_1 /TAXON_ID=354590 /ORGANISM="Rhodomonas lens, Strain RHODO" /LENGTH=248 /DNA_ID=CAMNT_0019214535 /DNA_START=42 /DNA_END=788 /DNA_ORIENTATION=+